MTIAQSFSKSALTYNEYAHIQNEVGTRLMDFCPLFSPSLILEVGSGTGLFTKKLKERFPETQLVAMDISSRMVEAASRDPQLHDVSFMCEDVSVFESLPQYDAIFSNATLHWVSSLPSVLYRLKQSLCPGGMLIFSQFGPHTFWELSEILEDASLPSVSARSFLSYNLLASHLGNLFDHVVLERELIRHEYPDLLSLFRTMKGTGTNVQTTPPFLTMGRLKKLEEKYLEIHGTISVTYEIFITRSV